MTELDEIREKRKEQLLAHYNIENNIWTKTFSRLYKCPFCNKIRKFSITMFSDAPDPLFPSTIGCPFCRNENKRTINEMIIVPCPEEEVLDEWCRQEGIY